MRRRTTGAMPAPEPIGEGDTTTSDVAPSLAPPLADGSNTYDLESLARDAGVAEPTDELDAILLVVLSDGEYGDAPTGAKAELILYVVDDLPAAPRQTASSIRSSASTSRATSD